MNPDCSKPTAGSATDVEVLAQRLALQGWGICERFVSVETLDALRQAAETAWARGEFRAAGVGRGRARQLQAEVRGDQVLWLNECAAPAVRRFLARDIEALRVQLNAATLLGLFEFEGHFAVYPPGSFYRRHLDRFRDAGERTVSLVLYLNRDWQAGDGGELRLFIPENSGERVLQVMPAAGTLVCFLSAEIPHEVLPAARPRFSLSGWFRQRA